MMIRKLLQQQQQLYRSFLGDTVKRCPNDSTSAVMHRMFFAKAAAAAAADVLPPISIVSSSSSSSLSVHQRSNHRQHQQQQQSPLLNHHHHRPRKFVTSFSTFSSPSSSSLASLGKSFLGSIQPSPAASLTLLQHSTPQIRTFANRRHQRILKYTKGYRGRSKNCFSIAIRRLQKAWQYAYRDRKTKKRIWRTLWIQRIQAGVRQYSIRYSRFIPSLQYANIQLNRKVLSELAATEPFTFKAIIDVTRFQQQQYDNNNHPQRHGQMKLISDESHVTNKRSDDIGDEMTPLEKAA